MSCVSIFANLPLYSFRWFCFSRQYEELNKLCEETKEKFTAFEQQDVRCREDLKHSKAKRKKLEKTLDQEKTKVC